MIKLTYIKEGERTSGFSLSLFEKEKIDGKYKIESL